jgi:hypothetical protein
MTDILSGISRMRSEASADLATTLGLVEIALRLPGAREDEMDRPAFEDAVRACYPEMAHTLGNVEHDSADDDGPCFCDECNAAGA